MMSKEDIEENLRTMLDLIKRGVILNNDINQIAMDRMREYLERYDKVKEIEKRLAGLIQSINTFGAHNRIVLITDIIIELGRGVPLEPNARIGLLENVKQFMFEESKKVSLE